MKALVKKFLDKEISRRGFMQSMAAMGFSLKTIDSVLNSVVYAAEELPHEGKAVCGDRCGNTAGNPPDRPTLTTSLTPTVPASMPFMRH